MTTETTPAKARLLEALRTSEQRLIDRLSGQPPEHFEQGAYESGWNRRQILAHVASIEWTYPRLIDLARGVSPAAEKPREPSPAPASSSPLRGGINDYNERQVEKLADATVAQLLDLFRENRARTIAAVEQAEADLFAKEIQSAGGIRGPLATVIEAIAVHHVAGHLNDIAG